MAKNRTGGIHQDAGVFPANSGGGKANKTATKKSLSVNTKDDDVTNPCYRGPKIPSYGSSRLNVENPPVEMPIGDPNSRPRSPSGF